MDFSNSLQSIRDRFRRPHRPRQPPRVQRPDLDVPTSYEANPLDPDRLLDFRFFVVMKTWMDEDIVDATVQNAFTQGAESVFVVDNGSTDATVERARDAGATIGEVFDTRAFDGPLAQVFMNAVVARESLRCGSDHVWWLYLDSDEFPEGPGGLSVRDYLATLDQRFRVAGSTYFNHLPTGKPEFVPGFHPIDFQPVCYEFLPSWMPLCGQPTHWKHPLQRFDLDDSFIVSKAGSHWGTCTKDLVEPEGGIVTHHFQYRDEALTRAKLELTCGPGSGRRGLYGSNRMDGFSRRLRSLDAVYAQRWDNVEVEVNSTLASFDPPRPWPSMESVRRWYSLGDVGAARLARTDD
jgi:glycosyltransferase involved in cell wall biosynthesis